MNMLGLALRSISGNGFRSWVVILCVLVLMAFTLFTTLVMRGAEDSLRLGLDRLGADIVVVPQGSETRVETALLMGKPATVWMPESNLAKIAAIPGVAQVSPQLYLASLANASCCSVSEMFLVAIDPQTDFTIRPWLERQLGRELRLGEAIGGSYVFVPPGEEAIRVYGYPLSLKGNLEPTGTGLDQTIFFTFETAQDIARLSPSRAETPLELPPGSISAAMMRLEPGADAYETASSIIQRVPGVTPIESPNLFKAYRMQMSGLLHGILAVLGISWVLTIVLIGLVFSIAAHERRREIGILRALGSTRGYILQSLLLEAGVLAVLGGLLGMSLAGFAVFLFHNLIAATLGVNFVLPSISSSLPLAGGGLALALASVTLAVLIPALCASGQDPAVAMGE